MLPTNWATLFFTDIGGSAGEAQNKKRTPSLPHF
jgi:hypothetical protein